MKYLIDTHVFIWFIQNSPNLTTSNRKIIEDADNEIIISVASLWEISIKNSIGKLKLIKGFSSMANYLKNNLIEILPITFAHTLENNELPFYHRDPFDRIIAAQAIVENIDFISADAAFDDYFSGNSIKRIW
jgi:PIN domain nuclease of toxin-antitoxin system